MSAKKHILVPRSFTAADVDPERFSLRDDGAPFHRMTSAEAMRRAELGQIEALGSSGKVWQLTDDLNVGDSWPTGDGRVSRAVPFAMRVFMSSEMSLRPSWCVPVE